MPSPFAQSSYQVRFEWGSAGLARLARADVIIVVDVLRFSSTMADVVTTDRRITLAEAAEFSKNGGSVTATASTLSAQSAGNAEPWEPTVLLGSIRNASAVARAAMTIQERRAARTSVAVIAAGELTPSGEVRFAVEDQLGAGAIIAALTDLGIDHVSPEAVVAGESFRALRRALRHLLGASGSARELADGVPSTQHMQAAGVRPATIDEAAELDGSDTVPQLSGDIFVPFE